MSQHTHTWRVVASFPLGLPTTENMVERFTQWQCQTCGQWYTITGEVRPGIPLHTPEWWDHYAAQEQRQATPHARQARQEQQRKRW